MVAQHAGLDQRAPGARVADELDAGLGVGPYDLPLLLGQLGRAVQDRLGDRELADVGQQQPHPETEQALLVAVVLALALVVEPSVLDDQSAPDQEPERGDVDRVLKVVGVGAAQVGEHDRLSVELLDLEEDLVDDVRELIGRLRVERPARGDGPLGLVVHRRDRARGQSARVGAYHRLGVDALAVLILDVYAEDARPAEVLDEASVELHARPEQGRGVAAGEDVARERRVLSKV